MKKCVIINAGPRPESTSKMLSEMCEAFLKSNGCVATIVSLYKVGAKAVVDEIQNADTVIVSGPCYVNTYPAPVIELLEVWAKRAPAGQKVYGIIQGGMPYTHTHKSGLNMLEVFAEKAGIRYCGGFVCGIGAIVDGKGLERLPNSKKVARQLEVFFANIRDGKVSGDEVYEKARIRVPSVMARFLMRVMNKSVDKQFAERGMDAYEESPYKFDELK